MLKTETRKRGSLIGFATGMDPNYKTSKKILVKCQNIVGLSRWAFLLILARQTQLQLWIQIYAIKSGANTEKIFKLIKVKSEIKNNVPF